MLHLHNLQLLFAAVFYPLSIYQYSKVNKGTVSTMSILRSISARFAAALDNNAQRERVKAIIDDESSGRITNNKGFMLSIREGNHLTEKRVYSWGNHSTEKRV